MRRREFIVGLGSAAAWPPAARAQPLAVPVIGYLDHGSRDTRREAIAAVHRGLGETGFVEGRNLAIEYRWAEDHNDQLPGLVGDLARRNVDVIMTFNTSGALAAQATTKSIPIVFIVGSDPVEDGLVASLNRPGGNLTGISTLQVEVMAKRFELLHKLLPATASIAVLLNPTNSAFAEAETKELQTAADHLGVRLLVAHANETGEFASAFTKIAGEGASGLLISGDPLFNNQPEQIVALAARHRLPTVYRGREAAVAGGLMSFGTDFPDAYRQTGLYAGRILKGAKPADLPVQQVTKIELVINLKVAKALGLTIPETLLATADEVIQ
jgi:putative tryptophan/tyrosine transport system substrate-binding protein